MPRFKQVSTIRIFHIPTQEIYDIARGLFTVTNRSGHVGVAFSHPVYGWPKMSKELEARGIRVGKERVRKLMPATLDYVSPMTFEQRWIAAQ